MWQVIDAGDHERREHLSIGDDAANRDATHADTVVAALAPDDAGARAFSPSAVVRHRDLECGVDSLRTRVYEEHAIVRATGKPSDPFGKREGGGMPHLEAGTEVERGHLPLDGLNDAVG